MCWKYLAAAGFLIISITAQHNDSPCSSTSSSCTLQQVYNEAISIQDYNRLMSLKVACENLAAANLNSGQRVQPERDAQIAGTQIPQLCRELELDDLANRKTSSPTPTTAATTPTVGFIIFPTDREPQIPTTHQKDPPSATPSITNSDQNSALNGQALRSTTSPTSSANGFAAPSAKTENALPTDLSLDQNFVKNLYQLIASNKPLQNVVYSPVSLQTILALTYTGASGQTANELRSALGLPLQRMLVFQQFGRLHKSQASSSLLLQMANKLYYNKNLSLNPEFQRNALQYFDAESERVEFADRRGTAQGINQWVASKTSNRILNLIQPETLDGDISAILVNAIYFRAKWANEFSTADTQRQDFALSSRQKVTVDMMYNEDVFGYADLSQLGAEVLQLPYSDSDLSMLIVLPHDVEGLAEVERRLRNVDLRTLPPQMQQQTVQVQMPKFRFEFQLDMVATLRKLQISALFSERAELSGIFNNHTAGISKVQHKAFIDVNEAGSEAAAATFNKLIPLSLPTNLKYFKVDHPFMFAIISPQAVYFMGHVVNFS